MRGKGQSKLKLSGNGNECKPLTSGMNSLLPVLEAVLKTQRGQGLTLAHFAAQPKPFWSNLPVSPCLINCGKIMHPTYPTKCAYVEPKSGRV